MRPPDHYRHSFGAFPDCAAHHCSVYVNEHDGVFDFRVSVNLPPIDDYEARIETGEIIDPTEGIRTRGSFAAEHITVHPDGTRSAGWRASFCYSNGWDEFASAAARTVYAERKQWLASLYDLDSSSDCGCGVAWVAGIDYTSDSDQQPGDRRNWGNQPPATTEPATWDRGGWLSDRYRR